MKKYDKSGQTGSDIIFYKVQNSKLPDFAYEKPLWDQGFSLVIGVDEVGRGPLAGPVVAGAASLKLPKLFSEADFNEVSKLGINDSKKLSASKREALVPEIKKHFHFGIGEVGVGFINSFGIRPATEKAMRMAVVSLLYKVLDPDDRLTSRSALYLASIKALNPYLLLDAFKVKYVPVVGLSNQQAIVKGDEKSLTIAAASIIAKVYRDSLMKKLHEEFPAYGFDQHSGYGTKAHIEALKTYGPCPLHRTKFIDGILLK